MMGVLVCFVFYAFTDLNFLQIHVVLSLHPS